MPRLTRPHAAGGRCRAGGRGGPGPVNFRPLAVCEGVCGALTLLVDDGVFRPRVVVRAVLPPEASVRGGRRPSPSYPYRRPPTPRRRRPSALARARRGVSRVGGDAPLGEKAFSSDPKRVPWGTASPSRRPSSARVSLASQGGPSAPCGEGPPSGALPAYRGPRLPPPSRGRVTHGPGPGIPGAVLRPRCCGRVRRLTPRGEVCGAGRLGLRRLPLLRVERLSARSRPEPRPVGAARARVGAASLGGVVPRGVGVSRAATGRLEREKDGRSRRAKRS